LLSESLRKDLTLLTSLSNERFDPKKVIESISGSEDKYSKVRDDIRLFREEISREIIDMQRGIKGRKGIEEKIKKEAQKMIRRFKEEDQDEYTVLKELRIAKDTIIKL
jgi:hypothetical protein